MSAITRDRRFTLSTHGVIELVLGLLTLVSPALLGFGPGAILTAVLLGSLLTGTALTVGADRRASPALHHLFDMAFVVATALATLGLAVAGQAPAALFFAGLTVLQAALNLATRYVATS